MSSKNRRVAVALALVLALAAAGAAHALPREGRPTAAATQPTGLFDTVWSWFAELFATGGSRLTAVWGQDGAIMDPNGKPQGLGANDGPGMDPNGTTQALTTADDGAIMDPNG